jgi:tetratricopeptide (TPR) repeat protein
VGDLLDLNGRLLRAPRCGLRRGTSATAWYELGLSLEASEPARAITAYERALAGRPDLADALNNLGRLHHEVAQADVATPAATGSRAVEPSIAPAPRPAATASHTAAVARAESCYRLAICAQPDIALYWFNLGVSVEDQGRSSEAIAAYEQAIELDPRLADAHFNLARLLEQVGRRSNDELVLRRAVRHLVRYRDLARAG